jgi:hypothetical protein
MASRGQRRHKLKADDSLHMYQAHLVLQGFTQHPGVDFYETFCPVVKPTTIRTVLTLALSRYWPVHKFDVKNAFLHDTLRDGLLLPAHMLHRS